MDKKKTEKQSGGITHKKDMNAGSGAFNQGAEQDPDYDKGTKVSDEDKLTGHLHPKGAEKVEDEEKEGDERDLEAGQ